jgi:gliding motility-associated lipoprotein GldH
MRLGALSIVAIFVLLTGCNENQVYREYVDFNQRYWLVSDTAKFQFSIQDTVSRYNVFCNIRNSTQYPYSRIFLNFTLGDTTGNDIHKALLNDFLFDPKTGKPFGKSGLGDLYDHQFPVLKNFQFNRNGVYSVKIEQFMRTDTLSGILSVGLDIEKAE